MTASLPYDREWYAEHFEYRDEYRACADALHAMLGQNGAAAHVLDYGCGVGLMLERLQELGHGVCGVEPEEVARTISPIRTKLIPELPSDWPGTNVVMCLEVAEHMSPDHGEMLCGLLASLPHKGGTLVFSAAQPGQGGRNHVNEQPPEYWIGRLEKAGLQLDEGRTFVLRRAWTRVAPRMWWLGRNVRVFNA